MTETNVINLEAVRLGRMFERWMRTAPEVRASLHLCKGCRAKAGEVCRRPAAELERGHGPHPSRVRAADAALLEILRLRPAWEIEPGRMGRVYTGGDRYFNGVALDVEAAKTTRFYRRLRDLDLLDVDPYAWAERVCGPLPSEEASR